MAVTVRMMLAKKNQKVQGVISIEPEKTVLTALYVMKSRDIGSLIVMREGHFLGIITERDAVRKLDVMGRSAATTLVQDIWTCCEDAHVQVVTMESPLQDCLDMMDDNHIRHLPVVEGAGSDQKVLGVISVMDVMKELSTRARENDNIRENLPRS